jgi:hypothetical protein
MRAAVVAVSEGFSRSHSSARRVLSFSGSVLWMVLVGMLDRRAILRIYYYMRYELCLLCRLGTWFLVSDAYKIRLQNCDDGLSLSMDTSLSPTKGRAP